MRVFRINSLLYGYTREAKDHNGNSPYAFERHLNLKVETFEDYLDLVDKALEEAKKRGDVGLKSALAYDRPLLFSEVEKVKAKRVFNKKKTGATPKENKLFEDYVFHHILEKAEKLGLPLQFHTGLALIEGSNPMNVVNLIRKYTGVNFMLFHGGYPWIRETAAITLSFPNVYIDLCWLPAISPSACRLLLREVIELGLSSRVTWGGDCWAPEGTYGALRVFKSLLSEVLQKMVDKKYLRTDEAIEIASRILSGNAARIFNL
jgi:predicted TIM-barrel fold metal-dependent hydrolase